MGYNLCGQIALSMIGADYGDILKNIWIATGRTTSPTDPYELLYAAMKTFSGNWTGKAYGWSQSYSLSASDASKITLNADGTFPDEWYFQEGKWASESWSGGKVENYGTVAAQALRNRLLQRHNLVILANLESSGNWRKLMTQKGIAHWVVITGFSQQWNDQDEMSMWNWVRVNNPYNNRQEYYPWKNFKKSISSGDAAGYVLLELWQQ